MRNREILARQFRLVIELHRHPRGLSSVRLAEKLGTSRPTVDRDLDALRGHVGIRIERERRSGEVWHVLHDLPIAAVSATPLQCAALHFARQALAPFDGTALVEQLDGALRLLPKPDGIADHVDFADAHAATTAHVVRVLDAAIAAKRRVALTSRVASRDGALADYLVEPIGLRFVDRALYLHCWAVNRGAPRTFKVVRIVSAQLSDEAAADHSEISTEVAFRNAVKAWSGEPVRVRVRLAREVAWMAGEYPLVDGQVVTEEPSGAAVVEATVAGLVEVSRWVLSWGRKAEVLDPPELRDLIVAELEGALEPYAVRSPIVSGLEATRPFKSSSPEAASRKASRRSRPEAMR